MGRKAHEIVFKNKIYSSVQEAARLTFYAESTIRYHIYKAKRGKRKALKQAQDLQASQCTMNVQKR